LGAVVSRYTASGFRLRCALNRLLGIRLGWLAKSYAPVVDRAWSGLSVRIAEDGGLADVCTGTGAGPNLRYYYERPAVFGFDDRRGWISLLAVLKVAEWRK
jgi:rhamnogalacturonyl hydrolase YesR